MPKKEIKKRVATMKTTLSLNTAQDWAGNFIGTLNRPITLSQTPMLTKVRITNLLHNIAGAHRRLFIFDYDGVLVPFKDDPSTSAPPPEVVARLKRLAEKPKTSVAVVSGRSRHDLDEWLGHLPITLVAEHGAMIRRKNESWQEIVAASDTWKQILKPALQKHAADTPGAFVEEKSCSLVWHFRNASPYYAQKNIVILKAALKPILHEYGLQLFMGNKILEIKRPDITKGIAMKHLFDKPYDFILAIGDDFTDEDMFRALPKRAYTVKVGLGQTRARYRIKSVAKVQELLRSL